MCIRDRQTSSGEPSKLTSAISKGGKGAKACNVTAFDTAASSSLSFYSDDGQSVGTETSSGEGEATLLGKEGVVHVFTKNGNVYMVNVPT